MKCDQDLCLNLWYDFKRWTQPSGPLCLWQCFWTLFSEKVITILNFFVLQVVGERNVGTVYDNLGFDCRFYILQKRRFNLWSETEYICKTFLPSARTFELGLVLRIRGNKHLQLWRTPYRYEEAEMGMMMRFLMKIIARPPEKGCICNSDTTLQKVVSKKIPIAM